MEFFVTGGFIILLLALLVPVVWFVNRNRSNAARATEDEEEPWRESLTKEDIQDMYGDREDRWKGE